MTYKIKGIFDRQSCTRDLIIDAKTEIRIYKVIYSKFTGGNTENKKFSSKSFDDFSRHLQQ